MGYFEEQIEQRKNHDNEVFHDAFIRMASAVLDGKAASELDDNLIRTQEAVGEILKFYRVKKIKELPENIKDEDEALEFLFRPYGIMRREINLVGNWYKHTLEPILAYIDGAPVALLPSGLSGNKYAYKDNFTGKLIKINKANANIFEERAVCFYKPLSLRKIKIIDLLNYMRGCFEMHDIFTAVIALGSVTLLGAPITQITRAMISNLNIDLDILLSLLFFMTCAAGAKTLFSAASLLLTNKIGAKISIQTEAAVMMRVLALPSEFFRKYNSGDFAKRTQLISQICSVLLNVGFTAVLSAFMSLFYLFQLADFAEPLVMPAVIIISALIIMTVITANLQAKQAGQVLELAAKESGLSLSLISGIQKIKLAGAEKRAFAKWAEIFSQLAALSYNPPLLLKLNNPQAAAIAQGNRNRQNNLSSALGFFNTAITLAGVILFYYIAAKNNISANNYFAFNTGWAMIIASLNIFSIAALQIVQAAPMLDMLEPILTAEPELADNKKVLSKLSGNIELNNVSFRYAANMPLIINNLSLKIRAGEYVAIVGATGCGKSTLMRLLLGFEKPSEGAVYYDDNDINSIDLKSLRRMIGVVTQDGGLFQGDIFSNIIISAPKLTLDDAWAAAETAGIADDIRAMPMGMHTLISDGQGGISGGQRQRIMIARAIAPKPKILIFDEATSALDNITQKNISTSLAKLKCTRIVIAHRLSTVKDCSRILVLDHGRIAEEGDYNSLIAKQGLFADLVERQQI
nr:ATP-binding cassette domain-containing protein [Synergistaceae bacterium]